MLQWNIKVVADIFTLPHSINHFKWKVYRVGIEQPDPVKPNVREAQHKIVKQCFPSQVIAIKAYILRNHIQLLDARGLQ